MWYICYHSFIIIHSLHTHKAPRSFAFSHDVTPVVPLPRNQPSILTFKWWAHKVYSCLSLRKLCPQSHSISFRFVCVCFYWLCKLYFIIYYLYLRSELSELIMLFWRLSVQCNINNSLVALLNFFVITFHMEMWHCSPFFLPKILVCQGLFISCLIVLSIISEECFPKARALQVLFYCFKGQFFTVRK